MASYSTPLVNAQTMAMDPGLRRDDAVKPSVIRVPRTGDGL